MRGWQQDKRWSDRFLDEIKGILGQLFIAEAPIVEDQKHNTDLIVLTLDALRIGCRVRKHYYYQRWPDDYTIRCARPSGTPTEMEKMLDGWGDYFFYGFSNETEECLCAWRVITLERLRAYIAWFRKTHNGDMPGTLIPNGDGSSDFRSFNTAERYVKATVYKEHHHRTVCESCGTPISSGDTCELCSAAESGWDA